MSEITDQHRESYDFYISREEQPKGWVVVCLESVSTKITDGTHKTPNYVKSGVRFISIKNIRPFQPVNWKSYEKYITRAEHEELTKRCNPERDDIVFPRIGTLGYAKRIDFDEEISLFVGLGLIKLDKRCVCPKYMEYYLNTNYIARLSEEKANGTGRMTLPLEKTRKFPFPLAPLGEQRRIVAKIEELFSELDASTESLTRARALLKTYRQSLLKAAFEGKLTADWRAANGDKLDTPSELLARIDAGQGRDGKRRNLQGEPTRTFDPLNAAPHGWVFAQLGNVLNVVSGATPKGVEDAYGSEYPFYKVGDMNTA